MNLDNAYYLWLGDFHTDNNGRFDGSDGSGKDLLWPETTKKITKEDFIQKWLETYTNHDDTDGNPMGRRVWAVYYRTLHTCKKNTSKVTTFICGSVPNVVPENIITTTATLHRASAMFPS